MEVTERESLINEAMDLLLQLPPEEAIELIESVLQGRKKTV